MNHNPFAIVKDSSIWQNSDVFEAVSQKDPYLRIGLVKKVYREKKSSDIKYLVEIQDRNDSIEVNARMLRKFGGPFNYEDYIYHGYKFDDKPDPTKAFDAKAGDAVLVAFLNGEAREAVILGGLIHPSRESKIDISKGPQYISEFNGVETSINNDGEYKLTFKAVPTNAKILNNKPQNKLPAPTYDTKVGGTYFHLDKTGSIEMTDQDQSGAQGIRIDKKNGTITIKSGNISLKMTKKEEQVDLKAKVLNIISDNKISSQTKESSLDASTSVKIKSPKVAIGKEGSELLDLIFQLIDMLSKVTPISPIGPCTPLISTPQWSQVAQVQTKIKEITGTL